MELFQQEAKFGTDIARTDRRGERSKDYCTPHKAKNPLGAFVSRQCRAAEPAADGPPAALRRRRCRYPPSLAVGYTRSGCLPRLWRPAAGPPSTRERHTGPVRGGRGRVRGRVAAHRAVSRPHAAFRPSGGGLSAHLGRRAHGRGGVGATATVLTRRRCEPPPRTRGGRRGGPAVPARRSSRTHGVCPARTAPCCSRACGGCARARRSTRAGASGIALCRRPTAALAPCHCGRLPPPTGPDWPSFSSAGWGSAPLRLPTTNHGHGHPHPLH